MKKSILIVISILFTFLLSAQTEHKEYYDNGNLDIKGYFDGNNNKIGEWKFYYENGKLLAVGKYENGKKTGEWKVYNENGVLIETINYKVDKEQKKSECSNIKLFESTWKEIKKEKKEGDWSHPDLNFGNDIWENIEDETKKSFVNGQITYKILTDSFQYENKEGKELLHKYIDNLYPTLSTELKRMDYARALKFQYYSIKNELTNYKNIKRIVLVSVSYLNPEDKTNENYIYSFVVSGNNCHFLVSKLF
jgi:hypothetical protein